MREWIKKNWKFVLLVVSAIAGIIFVKRGIAAIIGKVRKPVSFRENFADETKINVRYDEGWKNVKLPIDKKGKQLTFKRVEAVGLSKSASGEIKVKVEVKHEVTNRRDGDFINDSAASKLGK